MIKMRTILATLTMFSLLLGLSLTATAKDETTLKVGEAAPDFELADVTNGKTHKLSDYRGKTVVVTFHSITCPWAVMEPDSGYQRLLNPLAEQYADKDVVFLGINSNSDESVDDIAAYVKKKGFTYPILKDPGNKVADQYGGKTTPHFFVIDKDGVLRYQGGYEKAPRSPQTTGQSDEQYLVPALDAILAGSEPPHTTTVPKGCTIKRS